jgi:endonuclease YncB( thermonuclease family)
MSFIPFSYRAWVKRLDWKTGQFVLDGAVHDGDSAWFLFDRGVYEYLNANCRFWGVNAYELNDIDPIKRQKAQDGKIWLKTLIEGKLVFVLSRGLDKYGRPLVIVWLAEIDFGDNTKSVNKQLLDSGLAIPFMGELV